MGTQNRLVAVLAAVVAILFFIFVGLAVNYYSSAQAGKEAPQEETAEAVEPVKEAVSSKTEKKDVYHLDFTEAVFRNRFNQTAQEELSELGLHIKKEYIYSHHNISVYQVPIDNTSSLIISYETDTERLRGVVLTGSPFTEHESVTFLGAIAGIIAALSPELSPEERGALLKELGMFSGGHTDYKTINKSTLRKDILFKLQGTGGNGVFFYAAAKDIDTTAGSSVSRDDPHNIMADVTNFILWDAENQKKGTAAEKKKAASPQPADAPSYSDIQKAEYTLTNFHKKITDKEYTAAYNCLTKSYRKSLNYNSWVDGFKTTVSSVAYDINATSQTSNRIVLKYILRSEDKPGEIQYFSGEASIVKSGDEWKIDRIQNKKM